MRTLIEAGIPAGVLMAPIVPGITSHPRLLTETMRAIADSGAAFVGANVLRLDPGTREHFLGFLAREYPGLVNGYGNLYQGTSEARSDYRAQLRAVVDLVQRRAGLGRRQRPLDADGTPAPDESDSQGSVRLEGLDQLPTPNSQLPRFSPHSEFRY